MGRKQIIRMAEKSGFYFHDAGYAPILHTVSGEYSEQCFERFAALVAAKAIEDFCTKSGKYLTNDATRDACIAEAVASEREACAKVCDDAPERMQSDGVYISDHHACAAAIRARGQA